MSQHITSQGQDHAAEIERGAYNQAFSALGLEWYWDAGTYRQLQSSSGDKPVVQAYIEANHPHLLQAYAGGSLVAAIEKVRSTLRQSARH